MKILYKYKGEKKEMKAVMGFEPAHNGKQFSVGLMLDIQHSHFYSRIR